MHLTVYHASELSFIFGPVPDAAQTEFADQLTEFWINFVHEMNPGRTSAFVAFSNPISHLEANWPQYDTSSRFVMQLMRDNITLIPDGRPCSCHLLAMKRTDEPRCRL